MKRLARAWKVIIFDTLGVIFMLLALATGWLPGPGGIPLFLIGLSLIAVHHDWAQRYIDLLKEYADRLGDLVFINNRTIQIAYDIASPLVFIAGAALILSRSALWMLGLGIFLCFMALTFFLGNRGRFKHLKKRLKHKKQ